MTNRYRHEDMLAGERFRNLSLLNTIRFVSVSAYFALFFVLGGLLGLPQWRGSLKLFSVYWASSLIIFLLHRASAKPLTRRISRRGFGLGLSLTAALIDVPVIFLLQWKQFSTSNPGGIAGFTLGIYVLVVLLASLALDRRRIFFTAFVAAAFEGALQWLAGISVGAILASALTLGVAAWGCAYIGERVSQLLRQLGEAAHAQGRVEKLAAIGRIAGGIGHDLRSPLSALRMAHDSIIDGPTRGGLRRTELLSLMRRHIDQCVRISDDLLSFARESPLQLEAAPLALLIKETVDELGSRIPSHVSVQSDIGDDLPMPVVDRSLFRRALVNLVQNAAESVPKERRGLVRIDAHTHRQQLVISISDNGVGIRDEDREKVFEALFTTKVNGTGFGLAIVASILQRHHATLDFASKTGVGTTMTVMMPIEPRD